MTNPNMTNETTKPIVMPADPTARPVDDKKPASDPKPEVADAKQSEGQNSK
jgi:hypothetical protein